HAARGPQPLCRVVPVAAGTDRGDTGDLALAPDHADLPDAGNLCSRGDLGPATAPGNVEARGHRADLCLSLRRSDGAHLAGKFATRFSCGGRSSKGARPGPARPTAKP